jgi:hypothetical protein
MTADALAELLAPQQPQTQVLVYDEHTGHVLEINSIHADEEEREIHLIASRLPYDPAADKVTATEDF